MNAISGCALVTGATGSIGPAVVQMLCENGLAVRAVARHTPGAGLLPSTVEFIPGDITNSGFLDSALNGVRVVFHLAAKVHIFDPPPSLREECNRINLAGVQNIIESAKRNTVERIVFFSTINVYGPCNGRAFDESAAPNPEGIYARTKLMAERLILEAKRSDGQPLGVVLRLAAVYGPRLKGNYQKLVKALARKRFIQIGNGSNRRALIYEKDLARAAILAAFHPAAGNGIFNVSDVNSYSLREILSAICTALGRKPPRFSLPVPPMRALARAVDAGTRILNVGSHSKVALIDKYLEDVAVDSTRIQQMLGFAPQFDLASGWKDAIAEMKRTKEI